MIPKVSVILPVFNGEGSVARAVDSILAQTLTDFELLIFDDGSTDESVEICRRLAASDARIRLIRVGPNVGLGAAMNILSREAAGRLIAVQEQDDRSTPDRLRLQVAAFERVSNAVLVAGVSSWRDDGWQEFARHPPLLTEGGQYPSSTVEMVRLLYIGGCVIENATVMIRDTLLRGPGAITFTESRLSSIDWQFFLEAAHRGRFVGLPDVLCEMARGTHIHITDDSERLFADMDRCIDGLLELYGHDPASPISPRLRRHARARVRALRAQAKGIRTGRGDLVQCFLLSPGNPHARRVLKGWAKVALRKAVPQRR